MSCKVEINHIVANSPQNGYPEGVTFENQDKLPKLPIPPLKESVDRFLKSTQALQTPEDHENSRQVAQRFLEKDGPVLYEKLKDYAKDRDSYIEEFWDESYLNYTDSVVLSLNPFFILEDDPTPSRGSQVMRATSLILSSLGFIHDLRTGQLPPDNVRGIPLDMYQYYRLFGTARIPTTSGCHIQTDPTSRHIAVMRRGQIFWFDVLDDQHRPLLTERSLMCNIKAIINEADKTPRHEVAQGAIGVLSTEHRPVWARQREILMTNEDNRGNLAVVDRALFVVCLDDTDPQSPSELCNSMLCGTSRIEKGVQVGTCTNRYYDKLQIIVADNGAAGINFEHSSVDGHTVLRFAADVYTNLILLFARSINNSAGTLFNAKLSPFASGTAKSEATSGKDSLGIWDTAPKKLDWDLVPAIRLGVRFAETRLSDLITQNEVVALEFDKYGKNFITRHSFSPDAFVQMAFQATYFTLYGRMEATYEPAMTKAFKRGRTEAIRTNQPEAAHFVETFCSEAPIRDKVEALRVACANHTKLTKECSKGEGFDRLLYAMLCIQNRDDPNYTPEFFKDHAFNRLNHTVLSSSNCGNPALRLFGFAAVVPDGFGIGYIIKDDGLTITLSSKHRQTQRFADTLQAYLEEMRNMIITLHKEANSRPDLSFVDHHAGKVDSRTGAPLTRKGRQQSVSHGTRTEYTDMMGGYGFFGTDDLESLQEQNEARQQRMPVGTRLHLSYTE